MTEIKGRTMILICVALAAAVGLSGAWFRVSSTDDCAAFWGPEGAQLITGESQVQLLTIKPQFAYSQPAESLTPGIVILERHDLTGQPGMVHFRNALTLDRHFQWDKQSRVPLLEAPQAWQWALVFSQADQRLIVLLDEGFKRWGRLDEATGELLITPASYLDEMTAQYFQELGVLDKPAAAPPQEAPPQKTQPQKTQPKQAPPEKDIPAE